MTTQSNEHTFANELLKKIWTTRGSRFNAHRRLKCSYRDSIHAISFLAAYLFIITLPSTFPLLGLQAIQESTWSTAILSLSLLILVLSLLEAGNDFQLKAERLHSCALELQQLYDSLKLALESTKGLKKSAPLLSKASTDYANILLRYNENHETLDYHYFRTQHPDDFKMGWLAILAFKSFWLIRTFAFRKSLIWGPPIGFFIWLFGVR